MDWYLSLIVPNVIVLYLTFEVARRLMVIDPMLQFSWIDTLDPDYVMPNNPAKWTWQIPANSIRAVKWFGVLFVPLVMNVPFGTSWGWSLEFALIFGMFNICGGLPLGAGIASAIPWLWFSYQNMEHGLRQAQLHMSMCYVLVYCFIIGLILYEDIREYLASRR